ncbi:uncharacterized protein LOC119026649 isoform X5 [Acanthopagrus latus]|uniref:uncharacterized protein LOC119026649 isoform X5 n=1 Tax=Acanthopagrus latus TaxID=8177 RepID=UPI00187C3F47|nr:uncharacterized protein LOC119026649 isoform X5 [Acanthopagrus latus]XP_036966990.1 uncharacterized protein LOC119026649 isoform X5 [Acanthopagrus latus]
MEQYSSRLYSGHLSPAAKKILAVLRAQSLQTGRRNPSYSYNHRQIVERCHGSQRELLAQSSWSTSQEESRDMHRSWSRPQVSSFSTSDRDLSFQTSACYQSSQTADCCLSSPASSCWDPSFQSQAPQNEAYYQFSQIYSHRKYSEPPAYQSSQSLPLTQHELTEKAASVSHRDRFTPYPQTPERLIEHQSSSWMDSTEEIRPSFSHTLSPDDRVLDEVLLPTAVHPSTDEEEPSFARHPVSFCLKISKETDSSTSGEREEKKVADIWNIRRNEPEDSEGSDRQAKWKLPLSDPTEQAAHAGEGRGKLYQQLESEKSRTGELHRLCSCSVTSHETCCDALSNKLVKNIVEVKMDLENMTGASAGQLVNTDHEIQDVLNQVMWDATLLKEKGLANEMGRVQLLETKKNTGLEQISNLLSTSDMDKIFDCDTKGEKLVEKEENYFEYRLHTPEDEHPPGSESTEISVGFHTVSPKKISRDDKVSHCQAKDTQDMKHHTESSLMQPETKLVQGDNTSDNLESTAEDRVGVLEVGVEVEAEADAGASVEDKIETGPHFCSDLQLRETQCEADDREASELHGRETVSGESGMDRDESERPPGNTDECTSTEDSARESGSLPRLSQECRTKRSGFRTPCIQQHYDSVRTANGSIRGSSSSVALAPTSTYAAGQVSSSVQELASTAIKASKKMKNLDVPNLLNPPPQFPSFPLKRKHEILEHNDDRPSPKISLIRHPPKWETPYCSQKQAGEKGFNTVKRTWSETPIFELREPQAKVSPSHETGIVVEVNKGTCATKKPLQICQGKVEEKCCESTHASKWTPSSVTCKPLQHKRVKLGPEHGTNGPKISHEGANGGGELQNQSKAGCLTAALTSDPRVTDCGKLNPEEKMLMLEKAGHAKALVLTLVYRDGTTQLDSEQKLTPAVCGLLMLMRNDLDGRTPEDPLGQNDSLVYLKLEHTPAWAQQRTQQSRELFTRDMLLQVLSRSQLVVCYKAKDLLRTALQFYGQDLSWKQVAGCRVQDPQVSGWLLDPANPSSCYQDLFNKHCKRSHTTPALGTKKVTQVISGLCSLYRLNVMLCFKLQCQGLWELYSDMELNMISVLAAMESHRIHVDKEALRRTSDLLGTKMKQLEQEAHRAAGQIFLVTSNTQLRTVLFEKLCLQERCENKKLPKTINKQQQSTSEAALLQLQDLHPLPKIILEYRQVHKIKSTFVDGILSHMANKNYISSTWYQTSVVTGRISAKHPNFQALPRQPLQITKKQYIQGKEEEVVSVHPRAMFIPQQGWTFLAADFCQVELRLLAHLSSDPELLRIFTHPQVDVFTMLASQWKGVSEAEVTSEDREHSKRIVYSVVYGAGRERLSGILGVSTEQASRFQDSFLQTYREVQAFIQRTIQQCHKQGYVLSIMGRRRTLPNISAPDWGIRMQAERQAVNFVVQGSAADLCKMAMIRIFNLVSSSSSLSASSTMSCCTRWRTPRWNSLQLW